MDIFEKNKVLFRLVILLVFMNIISIGYLWLNHNNKNTAKPEKDKAEVAATLRKELNLSKEQEESMKALRERFFVQEKELSKTIKAERDSMNAEMFNQTTDTLLLNAIAHRVAENEFRMEEARINQALELKKICSPEQLKKFQQLVREIRDYFKPARTN